MKGAVGVVLRVIALTIIQFACFAIAASLVRLPGSADTPEDTGATAGLLLLVCLLSTIALTHIILRSRWSGWRLVAAVFVVFYGSMTVLPQIETAVFITSLPAGALPRLFLMGALIAAPFSVLAVLILGKRRAGVADTDPNARLVMPPREWAWKLALIAVIYVILYFTFGYYIAWQNPALREYYAGIDEGRLVAHMGTMLRDTPWLIPLQILRAILWVLIALPVIRMMRGRWQETALAIGVLFAVWIALLLLPNPYMPETVRLTHLVETAPSNFIFGFAVGWLLTHKR